MALVNKSGRRGLSAFLPDPSHTVAVDPLDDEELAQPPHLPLTATWTTTDFSVSSVVKAAPGHPDGGRVNLRAWVLLLLSRYMYMSGMSRAQGRIRTHLDPIRRDVPFALCLAETARRRDAYIRVPARAPVAGPDLPERRRGRGGISADRDAAG